MGFLVFPQVLNIPQNLIFGIPATHTMNICITLILILTTGEGETKQGWQGPQKAMHTNSLSQGRSRGGLKHNRWGQMPRFDPCIPSFIPSTLTTQDTKESLYRTLRQITKIHPWSYTPCPTFSSRFPPKPSVLPRSSSPK